MRCLLVRAGAGRVVRRCVEMAMTVLAVGLFAAATVVTILIPVPMGDDDDRG